MLVDIAELRLDPRNARQHNKASKAALMRSLAAFGQTKPIVLARDKRTVLAGNGTVDAAKSLGWTELEAVVTDLEGARAKAYALADNRTAELSTWDIGAREQILDELAEEPELQWTAWGEQDEGVPQRRRKGPGKEREQESEDDRAQLVVSCRAEDRDAIEALLAPILLNFDGALIQ